MEKQSSAKSSGSESRFGIRPGNALYRCLLIFGVTGLLDQVLGCVPRTYRT